MRASLLSQILNAPAGSVLIAHSAWWHRQTANTSPHPRHALLACFTRGYVVPKADMEGQYLAVSGSSSFWDSLDVRQQEELRRVMLGPHGRGLRGVHV
jgi:ectoine hydroxylase-related dioxygenase (phytanoyl-CoA dioxygenase family)